jgi:O-antigen ligase
VLSTASHKPSRLPFWAVIPPAVYLFILPFAHTIAVRWVALGLGIVAAIRYQPVTGVPRMPCILPITLWLIVAASSLAWAEDFGYSFGEFRIDVLYALAGFVVLFILTESERELRILLRTILLGAFIISAVAVASYLQHDDWIDGYQNFLGEFSSCMLMAIAVIPLVATEKAGQRKKLLAVTVALAMVFAAGLCARSRMFWISAFSMGLVAGTMYAWGKPMKMRIAVVLGLLLMLAIGTAGFIFASARPGLSPDSKDPRLAIWNQAFQNISEKPFSGAGFGRQVYKDRYKALMPGKGLYHAHNIFLSYGEQMGLQGIVSLVILFLALLVVFFRLWKEDDPLTRNVGIAGTALVIGVIVKSATDTHFGREVTLYFWALVGMLLGFGRRRADALWKD